MKPFSREALPLAINSLLANAVERFEVIDNYQENYILGGNSEKMVLKCPAKNTVINRFLCTKYLSKYL